MCVWTTREGYFPHTTNLPSLTKLGVKCVAIKRKKTFQKNILLHEFLQPFSTKCRPLKKRKNPQKIDFVHNNVWTNILNNALAIFTEIENSTNSTAELLQKANDMLAKKPIDYPSLPDIHFPKPKTGENSYSINKYYFLILKSLWHIIPLNTNYSKKKILKSR